MNLLQLPAYLPPLEPPDWPPGGSSFLADLNVATLQENIRGRISGYFGSYDRRSGSG